MKKSSNVVLNSSDPNSYVVNGLTQSYGVLFGDEHLNKCYDVTVSFKSASSSFFISQLFTLNLNFSSSIGVQQNTMNSKLATLLNVTFTDRTADPTEGFLHTSHNFNTSIRLANLYDIYKIDLSTRCFTAPLYDTVSPFAVNNLPLQTKDLINGDLFDLSTYRYICILKFVEV